MARDLFYQVFPKVNLRFALIQLYIKHILRFDSRTVFMQIHENFETNKVINFHDKHCKHLKYYDTKELKKELSVAEIYEQR